MKLPGTIEERLGAVLPDRWRFLRGTDVAKLDDADLRVCCSLSGVSGIQFRLKRTDVDFLRGLKRADFALLLARGGDEFEAHVIELKTTVSPKKWPDIQEQLEWAVVHVLAIAGVLGVQIRGVVVYTAYCNDALSIGGSPYPAIMKAPVGPTGPGAREPDARQSAEVRRSWDGDRIRLGVFAADVEHRKIRADGSGAADVTCLPRLSPAAHETRWLLGPVAG